jgi:hypothetical protein
MAQVVDHLPSKHVFKPQYWQKQKQTPKTKTKKPTPNQLKSGNNIFILLHLNFTYREKSVLGDQFCFCKICVGFPWFASFLERTSFWHACFFFHPAFSSSFCSGETKARL